MTNQKGKNHVAPNLLIMNKTKMSWCRIQHQDIFVSLENQPLTCHGPKRESQRIPGNLIGQRDGKSESS